MGRSRSDNLRVPLEVWHSAVLVAFFLTAVAANFWVIAKYGNATPSGDEWSAEALGLYPSYFRSHLSLGALLAPNNEHRIFTTRLLELLLIHFNGLWDPILQMMANAVIHAAIGVAFLLVVRRHLSPIAFTGCAVLVLTVIALPYGWENTLIGFNTHFYAVLLFGLIAIRLLSRESSFSWLWLIGLACGALSFLSLASGALVFLASFLVLLAKLGCGAVTGRRDRLAAAVLLAGFGVAYAFTPTVAWLAAWRPHSPFEFLQAFFTLASWPFAGGALIAAIVNMPGAAVAWTIYRDRPPASDIRWTLLGLWLWVVLQVASIAYGRAIYVEAPRYFDITALGVMVNFVCAVRLAGVGNLVGLRYARYASFAWGVIVATGLWHAAERLPEELRAAAAERLVQEYNVKAFLATGDFPSGSVLPDALPLPNVDGLAAILADKNVRRFLPSSLQTAMPEEVGRFGPERETRVDRLAWLRDGLLTASEPLLFAGAVSFLLLAAFGALAERPSDHKNGFGVGATAKLS